MISFSKDLLVFSFFKNQTQRQDIQLQQFRNYQET
jgi:hypothetical protein